MLYLLGTVLWYPKITKNSCPSCERFVNTSRYPVEKLPIRNILPALDAFPWDME